MQQEYGRHHVILGRYKSNSHNLRSIYWSRIVAVIIVPIYVTTRYHYDLNSDRRT